MGHLGDDRALQRGDGRRSTDRTRYPHVAVDIDKVRASGLVKDEIGLDQPDEKGTFGSTLLREAVQSHARLRAALGRVLRSRAGEPEVLPVLVVQVPDKAIDAKLAELVDHRLGVARPRPATPSPTCSASTSPSTLGARTVDGCHPESIQDDADVRVVLAKKAISTGWDCPRAEVLYSERPAKDATHIAQIIGRMVRQPLAHRIATDDALNSVACYLPLFDRKALAADQGRARGHRAGQRPDRRGAPRSCGRRRCSSATPNSIRRSSTFVESLPSITDARPHSPARCAAHARSPGC